MANFTELVSHSVVPFHVIGDQFDMVSSVHRLHSSDSYDPCYQLELR